MNQRRGQAHGVQQRPAARRHDEAVAAEPVRRDLVDDLQDELPAVLDGLATRETARGSASSSMASAWRAA